MTSHKPHSVNQGEFPHALTALAERMTYKARGDGHQPEAFEIRFGKDTLEEFDGDQQRTLFGIRKLMGLPVSFPEEPGIRYRMVEMRLVAGRMRFDAGISPEMMLWGLL